MQRQCNRKSRMAAARGKGQKQPEPTTEPKAAKSLGAYTHERWRHHAETAKAMTFAAFWRGLAALGCLPLPLSRHLPAFSLACLCIRLHRLFPLCIRLHRIAASMPPCAALRVSGCRVAGCRVSGCRLAALLAARVAAWRLSAALPKRAYLISRNVSLSRP